MKNEMMLIRPTPFAARPYLLLVGALTLSAATVSARSTWPEPDPAPPASAPVTIEQQQRAIHERVQRLEGAMLRLSTALAAGEPDKAERMRDALDRIGSLQIKTRVEQLAQLIGDSKFSQAEREQAGLLTDLDTLLKLLTSPVNAADARREERKKLEALKRTIRELMDEEAQHVYKTQHLERQIAGTDGQSAPTPESVEASRSLEQLQRETQQKASRAHGEMKSPDEKKGADKPGTESIEKAIDRMRQAGEKLGDAKPSEARPEEEKAIEHMQEALDELDDALRQVRKEEVEETLAALSTRLASLLEKEKLVREAIVAITPKSVEEWTRTDHLRAGEAADTQSQAAQDCEAATRLVTDEGTTVLIPELLGQMAAEMLAIEQRLRKSDASDVARKAAEDVIASLEELLALVEKKRDENRKADENPPEDAPQPEQQPDDPLLSRSAELKLLRSVQLRLNGRMPAAEEVNQSDEAKSLFAGLAARQQRLADLARRMNERGDK